MEARDKIKLCTELIQQCLVAKLNQDIGVNQIDSNQFNTYRNILNGNLHLVFDLLHQNKELLLINDNEDYTELLRPLQMNLVLMLCEQTAVNTVYQTDQMVLRQTLEQLMKEHFMEMLRNEQIFLDVLNHYKSLIKVNEWKRYIGAVFGFSQFCNVKWLFYQFYIKSPVPWHYPVVLNF